MLTPDKYRTAAGSEVTIRGKGGTIINFDWLEESSACHECRPEVDASNELLTWECDYCDGGQAELEKW